MCFLGSEQFFFLRWPTTVAAKELTLRRKEKPHCERKTSRQKEKTSRQKEKPHGKKERTHGKKKNLAAKRKRLTQLPRPHAKKIRELKCPFGTEEILP